MFSERVRVLRNRAIEDGIFVLTLESDHISEAMPGQFVTLSFGGDDPLIPRPLSVFDAGEGKAVFLVKIRGKATKLLSELREGDVIFATGPLGKPLPELHDPVLVAGGVGVAPLAFYARRYEARLLLGLPERNPGLLDLLSDVRPEVIYENTPDGGTVVELVKKRFSSEALYIACGPWAMTKALLEVIPAERVVVLAEGMMACGVGTCLVCAIPVISGGYLRVCTDGPWFRATEIDFTRAFG
ncbi:MAG: FAD-binding oxidoreductase [candidate division WOR-3 bacterium]